MTLHGKKTLAAIASGARDLKPFKAGNISGTVIPRGTGILPEEWRSKFMACQDRMAYVFYSYATPIAWLVAGESEWEVPDVKYSVSTTNHQSRVQREVGSR